MGSIGRGFDSHWYFEHGEVRDHRVLYSLPNVLPLLAMPSQAELVDAIMARALPRRPAA